MARFDGGYVKVRSQELERVLNTGLFETGLWITCLTDARISKEEIRLGTKSFELHPGQGYISIHTIPRGWRRNWSEIIIAIRNLNSLGLVDIVFAKDGFFYSVKNAQRFIPEIPKGTLDYPLPKYNAVERLNQKGEFVYLIRVDDSWEKPLKIGRTWNLKLRLAQHKRAKDSKVDLLGYVVCDNASHAKEVETELLQQSRAISPSRSEWNYFDPRIVQTFFKQKGAIVCL